MGDNLVHYIELGHGMVTACGKQAMPKGGRLDAPDYTTSVFDTTCDACLRTHASHYGHISFIAQNSINLATYNGRMEYFDYLERREVGNDRNRLWDWERRKLLLIVDL